MIASVLVLLSLSSLVRGHGCPKFAFSADDNPLSLLRTNFLPSSFGDFVDGSDPAADQMFEGVYDCHVEKNDAEVAVNAICNTTDCLCQALFQFQECKSCTLCVGADDSGALDITSFSADCSSLDESYPNCSIECGFQTSGCYSEDDGSTNGLQGDPGDNTKTSGASLMGHERSAFLLLLLILPAMFTTLLI